MKAMRLPGLMYWGSIVLAFVLTLMPLPDALRVAKPFWLAILVIYWALEAPERMGLGRAFLLGMVGDLLTGSLIGEQALRLVVLDFIVLRLRSRLRFFPMPQDPEFVGPPEALPVTAPDVPATPKTDAAGGAAR